MKSKHFSKKTELSHSLFTAEEKINNKDWGFSPTDGYAKPKETKLSLSVLPFWLKPCLREDCVFSVINDGVMTVT
jgi:hypothetical protein